MSHYTMFYIVCLDKVVKFITTDVLVANRLDSLTNKWYT